MRNLLYFLLLFVFSSNQARTQCTPPCLRCDYPLGLYCTLCESGYYLGWVSSAKAITCFRCPNNCEVCQDYKGCTECNTGYYLLGNNLYDTWCNICPDNCSVCKDHVGCAQCNDGYCPYQDIPQAILCKQCNSTIII